MNDMIDGLSSRTKRECKGKGGGQYPMIVVSLVLSGNFFIKSSKMWK